MPEIRRPEGSGQPTLLLIDEIKLLLEEKTTALMVVRTGIFILLAQLAILALLIVSSRSYALLEVPHLAIPFLVVNGLLFLFACYLILHSVGRIRHCDRLLHRLKAANRLVSEFLDD
ncbi:MAG: hypothetical protein KQJ78_02710 [Deltaproteobacteria bacterium]|nr:hypothetical protein [Deltaproteobacteria bacterium]